MIIHQFTNELFYGHTILWPSIIAFILGLIAFIGSDYLGLRILGMIIGIAGVLGIIECIHSGANIPEPSQNPITRVEVYPVELRTENNTLYVFVSGNYSKVSVYTNEFVAPQDTMFRYYYEAVGANLKWGESYYHVFKRNQNAVFLDSLTHPIEIEIKGDTTRLDLTPSGEFIAKPDSLQ